MRSNWFLEGRKEERKKSQCPSKPFKGGQSFDPMHCTRNDDVT